MNLDNSRGGSGYGGRARLGHANGVPVPATTRTGTAPLTCRPGTRPQHVPVLSTQRRPAPVIHRAPPGSSTANLATARAAPVEPRPVASAAPVRRAAPASASASSPSAQRPSVSTRPYTPGVRPLAAPSLATSPGSIPRRLVPAIPAAPNSSTANPQQAPPVAPSLVEVSVGSRIEVCYERQWIAGTIRAMPQEDAEGRWAVQCDVDDEGVWSFVENIAAMRPMAVPTPEPKRPIATGSASGSGAPVMTTVTAADGVEYFVVTDGAGNELGSFTREHIDFELWATAQQLRNWLDSLEPMLLCGLLSLLSEELAERSSALHNLKDQRDELYAIEDYAYFGLDANSAWKDVERAYRRLSSQLHPDKGGDVAAFSDMRKRYDRIRALRAKQQQQQQSGMDEDVADAGDDNDEDEPRSSEGAGGAAPRDSNAIEWDMNDEASMRKAHEDLRLQLVWASNEMWKVHTDIEGVQSRGGVAASAPPARPAGPTMTAMASAMPSAHEAGRENAVVHPAWTTVTDDRVGESEEERGRPSSPRRGSSYPPTGAAHAREDIGACLLCLEPLPNDPRAVVNLCSREHDRCLCLLHRACFLDPQSAMSDQLRRCMICKRPASADLVRQAVRVRTARG